MLETHLAQSQTLLLLHFLSLTPHLPPSSHTHTSPPPSDPSECLCELLYFMIFLTFTFWDSNLMEPLDSLVKANLTF